jgi:hypothetical protein
MINIARMVTTSTSKALNTFEMYGYHRSVAQNSGLRECDTVSLGEFIPTF